MEAAASVDGCNELGDEVPGALWFCDVWFDEMIWFGVFLDRLSARLMLSVCVQIPNGNELHTISVHVNGKLFFRVRCALLFKIS